MLDSPRSLVLLATLLLAACDSSSDDDAGDTETGGGELSHADDIQPIWDANCVSCHTPGGIGMPLDLTDAHAKIVGMASSQAAGVSWVEPGSAADSYIVAKLRGEQAQIGGVGGQMPQGQPALDDATISMIEAWIDAGAPE